MEVRLFRLVLVISLIFIIVFIPLSVINYVNFRDTSAVMRELFESCQVRNGSACWDYLNNDAVKTQGNRAKLFLAFAIGIPALLVTTFFTGQFVMTGRVRKPLSVQ